ETELGFGRGFYGLLAQGWEIEETDGKGVHGPIPPEAVVVENIVGALSTERASGAELTAPELNEQLALIAATKGLPILRTLTDTELTRVRARIRELHQHWRALAPGATLELSFDRPAFAAEGGP